MERFNQQVFPIGRRAGARDQAAHRQRRERAIERGEREFGDAVVLEERLVAGVGEQVLVGGRGGFAAEVLLHDRAAGHA